MSAPTSALMPEFDSVVLGDIPVDQTDVDDRTYSSGIGSVSLHTDMRRIGSAPRTIIRS